MKQLICCLALFVIVGPLSGGEGKKTDTKTYQVPYRLTNTNHALVRVKINGKGPYNFILDTGAPALFVSTAVCRKLGVTANREGWGTFDRFEIEGGVVLSKFKGRVEDPFQLEGMNGLGLAGAELHGIIGYTVLARHRLEFDFTKHKMVWTQLDFEPPAPQGLGGQNMPAGMDAIGSLMKILGGMLGKKPEQPIALRGFLGLVLQEKEDTVVVKKVLEQSPAAQSGLKAGDRIDRFQGQAVSSVSTVHRLAAKLAPEESAQLAITREGEQRRIEIKAGRGL